MTHFLYRLFTKNSDDNAKARRQFGIAASAVGIVLNLLLAGVKFLVGALSKSVSVTADAFNNLSDIGSYTITLMGFKMGGKPSDEQHPFGHGRIEYVAGLAVSFVILLMGTELIRTSAGKIANPETPVFNTAMIAVLAFTIPVKIWLSRFNAKAGRLINSSSMKAAASDSLNDVLATGGTIASAVITRMTALPVDGYIGILVALVVLYSGYDIARDTLSPLLGQAPDPDTVSEIENRILRCEGICGIHDIIVHNYGPESFIASAHAEVPASSDILKVHDVVDLVEREIFTEMGILITIHIDPIETDDLLTNSLKEVMHGIINEVDPGLSIHDFRIVRGDTHTNLIFDLVIPQGMKKRNDEIKDEIDKRLSAVNKDYFTVIIFDRNFV